MLETLGPEDSSALSNRNTSLKLSRSPSQQSHAMASRLARSAVGELNSIETSFDGNKNLANSMKALPDSDQHHSLSAPSLRYPRLSHHNDTHLTCPLKNLLKGRNRSSTPSQAHPSSLRLPFFLQVPHSQCSLSAMNSTSSTKNPLSCLRHSAYFGLYSIMVGQCINRGQRVR